MDLTLYLYRQMLWSKKTFGPGQRTDAILDHIQKELKEIVAEPNDLEEWIDVLMLALDGAWRAGYSPEQVVAKLEFKRRKNEKRKWPDWRTSDPTKAIEHVRTK